MLSSTYITHVLSKVTHLAWNWSRWSVSCGGWCRANLQDCSGHSSHVQSGKKQKILLYLPMLQFPSTRLSLRIWSIQQQTKIFILHSPSNQYCGSGPGLDLTRIRPLSTGQTGSGSCLVKYTSHFVQLSIRKFCTISFTDFSRSVSRMKTLNLYQSGRICICNTASTVTKP